MKVTTIPYAHTSGFSKLFLDYMEGLDATKEFVSLPPNIESFGEQIKKKILPVEIRTSLSEVLQEQYALIAEATPVRENIDALKSANTFTVTTGHQLCLATGPLYFIYKIISTIELAKQLKKHYPDKHFVPVYWMASEDHDFEEVNHFFLFGKKHSWESGQKGSVGKYTLEGVGELLNSIPDFPEEIKEIYTSSKTLSEATRLLVHKLFGVDGLVVLDGDNARLKKYFAPVLKEEIKKNLFFQEVSKVSKIAEEKGYAVPVHPREINLFYLDAHLRERIIQEGEGYKINNTNLFFQKNELLTLIDTHPEKFSPNVLMRPVYQEVILPNLAYIGGPAEVCYWMLLKSSFEYFQIPFPILLPRNFVLYINKSLSAKINKWSLTPQDIFLPLHELKKKVLSKIVDEEFTLEEEKLLMESMYSKILAKAGKIDKTMEVVVNGDRQKSLKLLLDLESRLRKAEERKNETLMAQVTQLKEKLFPEGNWQERHDNLMNFYINNKFFIEEVKVHLNPFEKSMYIISEHE